MYTFTRNELGMFKSICDGRRSVTDLTSATAMSAMSTYRIAHKLSSKKVIMLRREGKRTLFVPSSHGHSKALAEFLKGIGRSIDPLVGSRLLVLLSVSSNEKDLEMIAEETGLAVESVRRIVWSLKGYGVVRQERRRISVPQVDTALVRFLKDFSKGACAAVLEDKAPSGAVIWSEGLEFLFASREPVESPGISETGITAMSQRGLQFISDTRYYHYAYWQPRLRREDVALHNLLVDPNSSRGIAYSLLFLMKEGYNQGYLINRGEAVGVGELSRETVRYLDGETVGNANFPTRKELDELRSQYGVD
jgi:hypothetical protein